MAHKTLILGWPVQPAQAWLASYPDVTAARIYREGLPWGEKKLQSIAFRAPRWLQLTDAIAPAHYYGDWKNHIADYDTVILIDEVRGRDVFEYILEHNPSVNLCAFYDSPVRPGTAKEPTRHEGLPVRFFTCDREIARRYDISFAPYFYIFSPRDFADYSAAAPANYARDVFFIGEEKGDRAARIAELREIFDAAGITHELVLVPQRRHGSQKGAVKYMPYSEVQERIATSRAILELISDGQTGLTQRPFEALFLRKKLITNSREVASYDFYDENNIFILGNRPLTDLPTFLRTPYHDVPTGIKSRYTLQGWLAQFSR